MTRRLALLLPVAGLLLVAGCPADPADSGAAVSSCVERPGELPRPPTGGGLPCELIPPPLKLQPK